MTNFSKTTGTTWFIEHNGMKIRLFTFSLLVLYSKVLNIFYYSLLTCANKSLHFICNVILSFSWTSVHTSSFWEFFKGCFPPKIACYSWWLKRYVQNKKQEDSRAITYGPVTLAYIKNAYSVVLKVFYFFFKQLMSPGPWNLTSGNLRKHKFSE